MPAENARWSRALARVTSNSLRVREDVRVAVGAAEHQRDEPPGRHAWPQTSVSSPATRTVTCTGES